MSTSDFAGARLHPDDLADCADAAFELGRGVGIRETLGMSAAARLMLLKRLHEADGYDAESK